MRKRNCADGFIFGRLADVKTLELLEEATAPDGTALKLVRRDEEYLILAGGAVLMSSRMHGSEEELARLASERLAERKRVKLLLGGLGMGFTLRATLDLLAANATVTVAELIPAVVDWNRGGLGELAGHPLKDRRVRVETCDVSAILGASVGHFDAVLLDVDNGPAAFTASGNAGLYERSGIAAAYAALREDGVLAVWVANDDARFAQRLRAGGFAVHVRKVRGRAKKSGPRHTIILGVKTRGENALNGAISRG